MRAAFDRLNRNGCFNVTVIAKHTDNEKLWKIILPGKLTQTFIRKNN